MRFRRIDHIVLQVPDIDWAHERLREIDFAEAWPVGRNWPSGRTSGIALGGVNLELLQPDEDPPECPALAEIVFAPDVEITMEAYGRVVEKVEADPIKLAARGFPEAILGQPQLICVNAFPGADSLWPHFVCDYGPALAHILSARDGGTSRGPVTHIEIGESRARPRFVDPPRAPDLSAFIGETETKTGPKLRAGADAVVFANRARLLFRNLTIEA